MFSTRLPAKKFKMFSGNGADTIAEYLSSASEISRTYNVFKCTNRCRHLLYFLYVDASLATMRFMMSIKLMIMKMMK